MEQPRPIGTEDQIAPIVAVNNALEPIEEVFVKNNVNEELVPDEQDALISFSNQSNEEAIMLAANNDEDVKYEISLDQNDVDEIGNILQEDETEECGASIDDDSIACGIAPNNHDDANFSAEAESNQLLVSSTVDNDSDDEIVFVVEQENQESFQMPMPKTFELKGYVKHENDRFSSDLPFSQTVSV